MAGFTWKWPLKAIVHERETDRVINTISALLAELLTSDAMLKVKGPDIYIPPLTGKPWPAAVNNRSGALTGSDTSGPA